MVSATCSFSSLNPCTRYIGVEPPNELPLRPLELDKIPLFVRALFGS